MKTIEGGVFLPSWFVRQLTLGEKINLWRGKIYSARQLRNEVFSTDLRQKVTRLDLPVYFISGRYDYTVNHDLSKAYLAELEEVFIPDPRTHKGLIVRGCQTGGGIFQEGDALRTLAAQRAALGSP